MADLKTSIVIGARDDFSATAKRIGEAQAGAAIADLAWVFHWRLEDVERMPIGKLRAYHALAVERAPRRYSGRHDEGRSRSARRSS